MSYWFYHFWSSTINGEKIIKQITMVTIFHANQWNISDFQTSGNILPHFYIYIFGVERKQNIHKVNYSKVLKFLLSFVLGTAFFPLTLTPNCYFKISIIHRSLYFWLVRFRHFNFQFSVLRIFIGRKTNPITMTVWYMDCVSAYVSKL